MLGMLSEGFSGSDISIIVNEALMRPIKEINTVNSFVKVPKTKVREYEQKLGKKFEETYEIEDSSSESSFVWVPQIEGHPLLETSSVIAEVRRVASLTEDAELSENIFIRYSSFEDFHKSIQNCKPTVPKSAVEMYYKFLETYGHKEQNDDIQQEKVHLSYYA